MQFFYDFFLLFFSHTALIYPNQQTRYWSIPTVLRLFSFPSTDHSFFGTEWQKRWCALSHNIFYYYGSEKGTTLAFQSIMKAMLLELTWVDGDAARFHRVDSDIAVVVSEPLMMVFLISCNQTSSRRGSSISTGTLSRWTAPYARTQRRTVALRFRLQTSESIRYACLLVMLWVTASQIEKQKWTWDVPCLRLGKACVYMHFIKSLFLKPIHSFDTAAFCRGSTWHAYLKSLNESF